MKIIRCFSISLILLFLGFGCTSTSTPTARVHPETNILGILKVYNGSYKPVGPTTLPLRSGEISSNEKLSGDRVELFWGLITVGDY